MLNYLLSCCGTPSFGAYPPWQSARSDFRVCRKLRDNEKRRCTMGDKGKKDKDKGQKQKTSKQDQKAKKKEEKQPKKIP
jgi:hypothetical protein